MLRPSRIAALGTVTLALSACGGSAPQQPANKGPQLEKAIYMSAADCAEGGKLDADTCSALIEKAVKVHEQTSQTFKGLRSCEEASGVDRCEKDATGTYRMRLQAFMFELGGPQPIVTPLYPSIEGKIGFRDAKKKLVDARDDNLTVSQAVSLGRLREFQDRQEGQQLPLTRVPSAWQAVGEHRPQRGDERQRHHTVEPDAPRFIRQGRAQALAKQRPRAP